MKPIIELVVQEGTPNDRKTLLGLCKNPKLQAGTEVVYIYSLVGRGILYPYEDGKTIYIGEAQGNTKKYNTGHRFGKHVSEGPRKGKDTATNFGLSMYYWANFRIRLRIFQVPDSTKRTDLELDLIVAHMQRFGAKPIGQTKIEMAGGVKVWEIQRRKCHAFHSIF